jgi:hypothetical protein
MRTNSDLCHLQHKLIGFYNGDEKCLLRGTDWVFKYSSLRFVFKWLNINNFLYITENFIYERKLQTTIIFFQSTIHPKHYSQS